MQSVGFCIARQPYQPVTETTNVSIILMAASGESCPTSRIPLVDFVKYVGVFLSQYGQNNILFYIQFYDYLHPISIKLSANNITTPLKSLVYYIPKSHIDNNVVMVWTYISSFTQYFEYINLFLNELKGRFPEDSHSSAKPSVFIENARSCSCVAYFC